MYNSMAKKLTDFFILKKIIKEEEKNVYVYCFEVMISSFVYLVLFFTIAIVFKCLLQSILFLTGFWIIRSVAGGYHAKTYTRCHVLFMSNQIFMILLCSLLTNYTKHILLFIFLLISIISIFVFSPVEHKNNKHNSKQIKRFKFLSRFLILFITIISLILDRNGFTEYIFPFVIGSFSVSFSLIFEKLKDWRCKNEEVQ